MPAARMMTPALGAMLRASDGILDILPIATCICDAGGVILQYNRRAVEIWGRTPQPGQTHDQFTERAKFFDLDGTPTAHSMVTEVLRTGTAARDIERVVERPDGTRVIASINIDALRDDKGKVVGAVNCFLDITDRKRMHVALERSRQLALEQEQRLAATYEHASIGISEIAPDGRVLRVNEAMCRITGFSRDELQSAHLFRHTHPDDTEADGEGFRKQVSGALEFYSVEKRFVCKGGRVIWMSVRSTPVRDAERRLLYLVRVVQDVTERKAAEQRQRLLIDELNHRVKNTLATVQSLAKQTARSTQSPAAFRDSFEGRLLALSKAHDQLTVHHWESADLRDLLTGGLAPYAASTPKRIVLCGDDVVLRPRAVLTLAMAFHELSTNAAKYGSLSVSGGRVEIHWQAQRDVAGGNDQLRIDWAEQGGPSPITPVVRGFGSRLIEEGIAAELGGSVRLTFVPEGLRCEIVIPLQKATLEPVRRRETVTD